MVLEEASTTKQDLRMVWFAGYIHMQNDDSKLHFDTNHHPHIMWDDFVDLRRALETQDSRCDWSRSGRLTN